VLVDADTGRVIDGANDRVLEQVASLSKVVTALAVVDALPPGTDIPVSLRAEGMPARKINMKAGQTWELEHALAAMLMSSANDAAVALAEQVSGSVEAFEEVLADTAQRLGLQDHPVLHDPAGLDDEFSVGGGNLLSARDLAIAARAVLSEPRLTEFVGTREYRFFGGDNIHHKLINHNRMLRTYPGTVGVKTGFTERSGRCLIAAATRNGRTLIAVVVDVYDMYGFAAAQLDRGFALGPVHTGAQLPPVPAPRVAGREAPAARAAPDAPPVRTSFGERVRKNQDVLAVAGGVLLLGYLAVRARRRQVWRQKARRRALRYAEANGPPPDAAGGATHLAGTTPARSSGGTAGDQW
jgi:hypothetical protein